MRCELAIAVLVAATVVAWPRRGDASGGAPAFDHALTGWLLRGRHVAVPCAWLVTSGAG